MFKVEIVEGDIFSVLSDFIVVKYAQESYGIDRKAVELLTEQGNGERVPLPCPREFRTFAIALPFGQARIAFLGCPAISHFNYEDVQSLGFRALSVAAGEQPDAQVVAMPLHGTGFGLNESECLTFTIGGLAQAAVSRNYPTGLKKVQIIEINPGRVQRLREVLEELLGPEGKISHYASPAEAPHLIRAFVATPFDREMDDLFYYGILGAAKALGLVAERIDTKYFTGDIVATIRQRIIGADVMIADVTGANPNVFLEIGYAWGSNKPTVLTVKSGDIPNLPFDIKGQNCVTYSSIKELENRLTEVLKEVRARGEF